MEQPEHDCLYLPVSRRARGFYHACSSSSDSLNFFTTEVFWRAFFPKGSWVPSSPSKGQGHRDVSSWSTGSAVISLTSRAGELACLNSFNNTGHGTGVPVLVPVRASPVPSVVRGSGLVKFFSLVCR